MLPHNDAPRLRGAVLVTGASGFVGAAMCRELLARGHNVRALVRNTNAELPGGVKRIVADDFAGPFDTTGALEGVEAVVHLAAIAHRAGGDEKEIRRVNVESAAQLAEAAAGRVRRFVFLSSVKVHGEDSGERAYAESDTPHPEDIYGRSKLEAERAIEAIAARGSMEYVAIRAPLVYGPGVKANFLRLMRWVDHGVPLPLAVVRNRRSLVYLGNLVDAIALCVEHPEARGTFLVSDEECVSTAELTARIARTLGRSARLVAVPTALLKLAGALTGRSGEVQRLTVNLIVDATRIQRLLGWQPRFSLDEGLAETAKWYRSSR